MKHISTLSLAVVALLVLSSCSAVKWATPATAGSDMDDESWASRYIPGVRAVSNFIPPPTEGRILWDEHYKKRGSWGGPPDQTTIP